jgi:hypothetical protein
MPAVETAVLDACVLFRGVRDFLLWVAEAGAFIPAWSEPIHGEWMRNHRDNSSPSTSACRSRYRASSPQSWVASAVAIVAFGAGLKNVAALSVLLVFLFVRPGGILGEAK